MASSAAANSEAEAAAVATSESFGIPCLIAEFRFFTFTFTFTFLRFVSFQGPRGQTHTHKPRQGVRGRRLHRHTLHTLREPP